MQSALERALSLRALGLKVQSLLSEAALWLGRIQIIFLLLNSDWRLTEERKISDKNLKEEKESEFEVPVKRHSKDVGVYRLPKDVQLLNRSVYCHDQDVIVLSHIKDK
jgi:hypothetical protein